MFHKIAVYFRQKFSRQRIGSSGIRHPADYTITTGNCAVYPFLVASAYKWKRVILFYDDINFAHGEHLVINFSRIMSRSRTRHRDLRTRSSPFRPGRPNSMFVPTDNQRFPRRVVANIHESRGDRKISGGGKYSNRRHRHRHRPEHPWPTPHSENTREAHPGAPFIAGLAEGRRRARREKRRGRVRTMSVAAGRAGNLIANTFHSPANFKPISSVYCQSQRARNSSLSVRNEILPMVPFRRSPWPFDLHWRRLDNLRIPRTRVATLKRERFVQR